MSRIVLMGSGETAPAMVKTHRAVLAASGDGPAVMLDTPYGFQVNADDLTHRTLKYFDESVGQKVSAAQWRTRNLSSADREKVLAELSRASWLFAGPGSPTYALDQWHGTPIVGAIGDVVDRGGSVVLGSAAAVTAGRWALPVYEIYKVGAEPHWVPGLDLLKRFLDLSVAVIPHYDNAEGGTYDTRFCYLGSSRLESLEKELPSEAAVLGVDEHTAVIVDLHAGTVEVSGVGRLTVRRAGVSEEIAAGTTLSIDDLRSVVSGELATPTTSQAGASVAAGGDETQEQDPRHSMVTWRGSVHSSMPPWMHATSMPRLRPSCPSTMHLRHGRPTPCRATHSTVDAASCARWSCGSASWPARALPIPPTRSPRWSKRFLGRAQLHARRGTSPRATASATHWQQEG